MANLLGPGWNRPQDAVYPLSQKDADGDEYDGAKHSYVMRFEKGQLPPVDAFWSLTMYDTDFFFVPNAINRYDLRQRDKFVTNADGSVDMYIQAESPGKDKEANWLPAPKGKFVLVMRMYAPTADAADDPRRQLDAAAGEAGTAVDMKLGQPKEIHRNESLETLARPVASGHRPGGGPRADRRVSRRSARSIPMRSRCFVARRTT